MIIVYQKRCGSCNAFAVVPEGISWRLETAVYAVADAAGDDPGYIQYALNLVMGRETVDTVLLSEELRGIAAEKDEEEAILGLMNRIVDLAAGETAEVLGTREQILDLGAIVREKVEAWIESRRTDREA